jgi:hypothetical protein
MLICQTLWMLTLCRIADYGYSVSPLKLCVAINYLGVLRWYTSRWMTVIYMIV